MYPHQPLVSLAIFPLLLSLNWPRTTAAIAANSPLTFHTESIKLSSSLFGVSSAFEKQASASKKWQEFSSLDGRFSILMPGKPTEEIKPGSSENGIGDLHLFWLFLEEETVAYGVGYKDFKQSSKLSNSSKINEFLNTIREGIVKEDRLMGERSISLNGYLGREFEIESPQGFISKFRIYWVENRLYQVVVGSPSKATFPQEANKFFNSFKLLATNIAQRQEISVTSQSSPNRADEAQRLYEESFRLYQQKQFSKALETLQQVLTLYREMGNRSGEAEVLTRIGRVYDNLEQYDLALEVYEKSTALARETSDRFAEGINLDYIGRIYQKQGQYAKALDLQQQALAIFKEVGNRRSESIVLANLGMLYAKLKQSERALEVYQQALTINREIGERMGEGVILDYIGVVYSSLDRHKEGLELHQQALAIFQELGNRRSQAIVLNNIGSIYRKLKQNTQALEVLERALKIFQEIGDKEGIASTLVQIEKLR